MLEVKSIVLFLLFFYTATANMSLNDHVVKMEQVILSVEYNHRHLNVWKENNNGFDRFYVTPLCTLETSTINCTKDEYSNEHRHILTFHVKIWDLLAAETIKLALANKNINATLTDILPLPMLMVRLGISQDVTDKITVDKQWRSNQDQPNIISFELFTKHEHFCDKMVKDAKSNPESFLARTKLFLEFTMIVGQLASRSLSVTGQTFVNSKLFSNLDNKHSGSDGTIYLTSSDLNKLARDIYRTASAEENVTSTYVQSEQENHIISELLNVIKGQTVHSKDLEDWNSVFWNDIFSRPDVQTEYFNEALKYDEGEKNFKYNSTKDNEFRERIYKRHRHEHESKDSGGFEFSFGDFGFGANAAEEDKTVTENENDNNVKNGPEKASKTENDANNEGNENKEKNSENKKGLKFEARYEDTENSQTDNKNTYDVKKVSKNTMSLDDLQKHLKKDNVNVRWSGTKFTPKDLLLYRLNTKTLKTSGEVFFKRIVTTKFASTQKIEIRPQRQTNFDNTVSPAYYEDLKNELQNLQKQLLNTSTELKSHVDKRFTTVEKDFSEKFNAISNQVANNSNKFENEMLLANERIVNISNFLITQINEKTNILSGQINEINGKHDVLRNEHNALQSTSNDNDCIGPHRHLSIYDDTLLAEKPGHLKDCCKYCKATPGCQAYEWLLVKRICLLKSSSNDVRET